MPFAFPPIDVLLTWPVPNFKNPIKRGPENYVVGGVFLALATVALAMRLYARLVIRRWFGLDDVMICVAFVFAVGVTTSVMTGVFRYGWDRHIWDVEPDKYVGASVMFYVSAICWAVAASCVRLSLLCFYYRLTAHVRAKQYLWVLHVTVAISVAFLIAYIFSLVFFCLPASDFWMKPLQWDNLKCTNIAAVVFSMSIINTFLELVVALLPVPFLFNVNMSSRQRWSIISVLSLGMLVTLLGCVRCWFIWQALVTTYDATWWGGPHWTISEVENNVAIMCACAPALRPVFGRLFSAYPIDSRPSTTEHPLLPQGAPGLKPKHSVEYPLPNNVAYVDLEGIADDGKGYTFLIMGDDESYIENLQKGAKSSNFFGRLMSNLMSQGWRTRTNRRDTTYSSASSNDEEAYERGRTSAPRGTEYTSKEMVQHRRVEPWDQIELPSQFAMQPETALATSRHTRNSWTERFPPIASHTESKMESHTLSSTSQRRTATQSSKSKEKSLPSPPPAPAEENFSPISSGEATSSDYLGWAKRSDPSKRFSPNKPINSSHPSSRLPRPDRRDRGRPF